MKKSDLKTGMVVELRSGQKLKVFTNCVVRGSLNDMAFCTKELYYMGGEKLNDDLTATNNCTSSDIIKVYDRAQHCRIMSMEHEALLWEREKPFLVLDGVEYSESTLRSIIKKVTN